MPVTLLSASHLSPLFVPMGSAKSATKKTYIVDKFTEICVAVFKCF
jgi:hypothetical protein